jgi:hypothetical protein
MYLRLWSGLVCERSMLKIRFGFRRCFSFGFLLILANLIAQASLDSLNAEPLSVGPFSPKLTLFGASIDPLVNISADVTTKTDGLYARGDIVASLPADKMSDHLVEMSKKLLPTELNFSPCRFEIVSVSSPTLIVVSNTGEAHANVYVVPHGCPLVAGDVTVDLRFGPSVVKSVLSFEIARLDVSVPSEWRLVGFFANKDPSKLIAAEIRKRILGISLSFPASEHVHAALQGASLDLKADNFVVRIRADARMDRSAITTAINTSKEIQSVSMSYP